MKYIYRSIILFSIICITFTFSTCENFGSQFDLYIKNAENIIEQSPETAMQILDSITDPNDLTKGQLYKYHLLKIQSKDKLYEDITQDSIIFTVCDYYINQKKYLEAAKSCYYAGRVLHEQQKTEAAIHFYNDAQKYADYIGNNYNLNGIIQANMGYLLFRESAYDEALTHFGIAAESFQKENNVNKTISINVAIGNCYMMKDETDSAYFYYGQSLTLANASNLPHIKLGALQNLGLVYQLQENYNEAIDIYRQALILADSTTKGKVYLSLTRIYSQINNLDSSNYYFNKALAIKDEVEDPYFMASLDEVSSEINERAGNCEKALSDYKSYVKKSDILYEEQEKKTILDIQKKYQYERIKNHNNELYIRNTHFLGCILFLGIVLLSISFLYYYHLQKKKRKLDEAEKKIIQLDNLALSYNEKRNSFRDILLHQFDILRKSATLQNYLREDEIKQGEKILKKFNDIVYKQEKLNWNMLYGVMNELHDGFLDKLKHLVPELDESEFKICCLIHSGFTNQEMTIIMKLSLNTITHKRTSIRKKMRMQDYNNINRKLKELSNSL